MPRQGLSRSGIINSVIPFLIMGIFIIGAILALVLFSYLLFWTLLAGFVLYLIACIKTAFFKKKTLITFQQKSGNIYDHED